MGHPDGQDYAVWRGPVTDQGTKTLVNNATYSKTVNVTNFASVLLSVKNINNGIDVNLTFFTDSQLTESLGTKTWNLISGTELHAIVPAAGNYATVRVIPASAVSTSFDIVIMPTNTPVGNTKYVNDDNVHQVNNMSIPANTTDSFTLLYVEEGTGILNVAPNDASGKLTFNVEEFDLNGVLIALIAQVAGPTSPQNGIQFNAGTNPVKLVISNSDTVSAHSCYATCRILSQ